jgi:hypothetical protein
MARTFVSMASADVRRGLGDVVEGGVDDTVGGGPGPQAVELFE